MKHLKNRTKFMGRLFALSLSILILCNACGSGSGTPGSGTPGSVSPNGYVQPAKSYIRAVQGDGASYVLTVTAEGEVRRTETETIRGDYSNLTGGYHFLYTEPKGGGDGIHALTEDGIVYTDSGNRFLYPGTIAAEAAVFCYYRGEEYKEGEDHRTAVPMQAELVLVQGDKAKTVSMAASLSMARLSSDGSKLLYIEAGGGDRLLLYDGKETREIDATGAEAMLLPVHVTNDGTAVYGKYDRQGSDPDPLTFYVFDGKTSQTVGKGNVEGNLLRHIHSSPDGAQYILPLTDGYHLYQGTEELAVWQTEPLMFYAPFDVYHPYSPFGSFPEYYIAANDFRNTVFSDKEKYYRVDDAYQLTELPLTDVSVICLKSDGDTLIYQKDEADGGGIFCMDISKDAPQEEQMADAVTERAVYFEPAKTLFYLTEDHLYAKPDDGEAAPVTDVTLRGRTQYLIAYPDFLIVTENSLPAWFSKDGVTFTKLQ